MATVPVARLRDDLVRLADRGADVAEYARAAARVLGPAVPFDGVCVVTMDPSTQLPTSEFVDSGLPESTRARMAEIEGGGRTTTRSACWPDPTGRRPRSAMRPTAT